MIDNKSQFFIYDNLCPNSLIVEDEVFSNNTIIYAKDLIQLINVSVPAPYSLKLKSLQTELLNDFEINVGSRLDVEVKNGCINN